MKNKLTIYYAGNELMQEDAMPFRLVPMLQEIFPDIDFVHHDPSENLPESSNAKSEYDIVIIDTVINTDKVVRIMDEKQLSVESIYSPHDWDLAFNLKLLLKLGKIKSFLIIGVPPEGDLEIICADVANHVKALRAQPGS